MDHYKLFIDGEFVDAQDGKTFESIDPGTGLPFATVAQAGKADAEAAIEAARRAFDRGDWSGLDPAARAAKIYDFADHVMQQGLRLAVTESMDSGQVIGLAKFLPMLGFRIAAQSGLLRGDQVSLGRGDSLFRKCLCPRPRFYPPRAGGSMRGDHPLELSHDHGLLEDRPRHHHGEYHRVETGFGDPLSALIIAECVKAAGIPKGVVNILAGPGGELGKVLCTHPSVDKIAFTGSTEVGREIMRMAADTVKKVTLELGGKSPNIILDDADMDLAVEGACFGTFFHQGQICESGTRVLVSAKIYDEFIDKMKKRSERLRIGYQLKPTSHQGPLVNDVQLATVERYVKLGKQEGAEMITGGKRVEVEGMKGGFYYAPTIFVNVKNKMRIAQEEIFGPVVGVLKFDSDEEAVAIANDTVYGLGGAVFSSNTARAERVARGVRTGTMWINNYHAFGDFCPFGGYKQSGVGREFGYSGLSEYTQVKRMHVAYFADRESNYNMNILNDNPRISGLSIQLPHQRGRGPWEPGGHLQGNRESGLPQSPDPDRSRGEEGGTGPAGEGRPGGFLRGDVSTISPRTPNSIRWTRPRRWPVT